MLFDIFLFFPLRFLGCVDVFICYVYESATLAGLKRQSRSLVPASEVLRPVHLEYVGILLIINHSNASTPRTINS